MELHVSRNVLNSANFAFMRFAFLSSSPLRCHIKEAQIECIAIESAGERKSCGVSETSTWAETRTKSNFFPFRLVVAGRRRVMSKKEETCESFHLLHVSEVVVNHRKEIEWNLT